ncbi:hypothetical protein KFU94_38760 [Chloroflexi bacterium TSY]|nr:hypothetical protein [Chloroflexi bacterium TSY]
MDIDLPSDAGPNSVNILPTLLGTEDSVLVREDLIHPSVTEVFSLRRGAWTCIFETQDSGGWPPEPDAPGQLYN